MQHYKQNCVECGDVLYFYLCPELDCHTEPPVQGVLTQLQNTDGCVSHPAHPIILNGQGRQEEA